MTSLSILIACLLDNVRILQGEISCLSLLGVKGLNKVDSLPEVRFVEMVQFHTRETP